MRFQQSSIPIKMDQRKIPNNTTFPFKVFYQNIKIILIIHNKQKERLGNYGQHGFRKKLAKTWG
jgi:hypothetical protein